MRAFIAIELSPEIKDSLSTMQSRLKYSGADVKWVEVNNIHLTLKFLGDIIEEKCESIKSILDEIGRLSKPFEISIKNVGAFPNINYPRVIWVGLDKGAAEATALAENIGRETVKLGFQKEALKEKISTIQLPIIKPHAVSSVALFESKLSPKGPIYTRLHEARLG